MRERGVLRPAQLGGRGARIDWEASEEERAELARALGLPLIGALRLSGRIEPEGRRDWRLGATLEARAVQECVVTLEPVESRLSEPVERLYVEGLAEPEEPESEMPDETREPLPAAIDLREVAAEALTLALPPFPRAPGAELGRAVFAEPGARPMTDEEARPFAGLAALRDRMARD